MVTSLGDLRFGSKMRSARGATLKTPILAIKPSIVRIKKSSKKDFGWFPKKIKKISNIDFLIFTLLNQYC